ncbi:MAG: hypothetical protein ACJA0S_001277 [Rickettsiales bacterium]|jgi:hypothetical protein
MIKYLLSKKEYLAINLEDLLRQIKNENSHTKDLSLQEYMDNVAAQVINNMTKYEVSKPATAQEIIDVWKRVGMIKKMD